MRQSTCENCKKPVPMNQMFTVFGKPLCTECANQELGGYQGKQLAAGDVTREVDPTICVHCQMDNGNEPYPLLAGAPACESCEAFLRHRPYPAWLKAAAFSLFLLAAFAFVHNWRFVQAYLEWNRGMRLLQKGDLDKATPLIVAAADHVPESEELDTSANMFRAISLLKEDKPRDALQLLQQCKKHWPNNPTVNALLLQAELGAAFDDKDYDKFLAAAQTLWAANPNDPSAMAAVASAYACKYAVTGQDSFKKESLRYLDLARQKAPPGDPHLREYAERITHRLQTREIITREEYERRFPPKREEAKP